MGRHHDNKLRPASGGGCTKTVIIMKDDDLDAHIYADEDESQFGFLQRRQSHGAFGVDCAGAVKESADPPHGKMRRKKQGISFVSGMSSTVLDSELLQLHIQFPVTASAVVR